MKRYSWEIKFGLALIAITVVCYTVQLVLFHRPVEMSFLFLQDLGFVWVQVLLVTLGIDQLMRRRDLNTLKHRLNMVIGAFFNESGRNLLGYLSRFDVHRAQIREIVRLGDHWTERHFARVRRELDAYDYSIDCHCADLSDLKDLLAKERHFFVNLLVNTNLLQHESFTELLWAISHLAQELMCRDDVDNLPESETKHIEQDMRKVYILLTYQWLLYVWHLQHDFPYIYEFVQNNSPYED